MKPRSAYYAVVLCFASTFATAQTITGSGTKGYIPIFNGTTTVTNSRIYQDGSGVGINKTSPTAALDVNGNINSTTGFNLGGSRFAFGSTTSQNVFLGFAGNSTTMSLHSSFNTAIGVEALHMNTTGSVNTAFGGSALGKNTTGNYNSADGWSALAANTSGEFNIAMGSAALGSNTTGSQNTAFGYAALGGNLTANNNTATGWEAMFGNTYGFENTAVGSQAMESNTTGYYNTGLGRFALKTNTTGALNTAVGFLADVGSPGLINATAIGAEAVVNGSNALVLGSSISQNGLANTNVGIDVPSPVAIFQILQGGGAAYADGWATYSSRRFKTNIHTLDDALAKVEQLRGVAYDLRSNGKHEIGVIAEEVGTVVPEVVAWQDNGKDALGVDYSRLTALLIEAVKSQQAEIDQLKEQLRQVTRVK